jgi:uncharacterized phage protein (TIGR02216 family)
VLAFGLGVLKLAPDAFWRATPIEIAAAMAAFAPKRAGAPSPADLARLLALHPDE